ncbi:ankyrin repeat ph and sec7 domain containing protein secg-related [Anaeramoeba ignava]|uniref:Ankyrin repeat ph and sec7 domain containing protein secg-related n=1 Tax=Anaeramoeba ignava TaxID=1746090 RepID=A0A9Q0LC27_ANAIG|nr:ankyrin repeat ph and sec7 domain containing protein secg-related [Anaeramoeba ignava]
MQTLREAIILGDLYRIQRILQQKLNLVDFGADKSALHFACGVQNISPIILRELIFAGSDVNVKNKEIPLHILCKNKPKAEAIHLLITLGSNPNAKNKKTCLHQACMSFASLEGIQALIEDGADCTMIDSNSPLHEACKNGCDLAIIQLLVDNGADVNLKNRYTPLHFAAQAGTSPGTVDYLISKGAKVTPKTFQRAIHLAINSNANSQLIHSLITAGCPLDSHKSIHALKLACQKNLPVDSLRILYLATQDKRLKSNSLKLIRDITKVNQIKEYSPLGEDILELFTDQEYTDMEIECSNGSIRCHALILNARIGENNMKKALEIFKKRPRSSVTLFMNYIYGGIITTSSFREVTDIAKSIGISTPSHDSKINQKSLLKTFRKLYSQNSSKDFEIIVDKKSIKVHKLILLARSDYFEQLIQDSEENVKSVKDGSNKSYSVVQKVIKSFYFDEFNDLPQKEFQDLRNVVDFYQPNQNSIPLQLAKNQREVILKAKNAEKFIWKEFISSVIFLWIVYLIIKWAFYKISSHFQLF